MNNQNVTNTTGKMIQVFIIMGALAILVAALWYWVYFVPHRNRMEELQINIDTKKAQLKEDEDAANERIRLYNGYVADIETLSEDWAVRAANLPEKVQDSEVLRHIQDVIYPHTERVSMSFGESTQRGEDMLYSTTVTIEFATSYWQFLSILHNLVQGELGNRVVHYEIRVTPLEESEYAQMISEIAISDAIEFIPEDISVHFLPGAQVDPIGLHTLAVNMRVEYLSLEAGILSDSDLRIRWAASDAIEELAESAE